MRQPCGHGVGRTIQQRRSVVFMSIEGPVQLAGSEGIVHTPSMTLKNAALLALIGTTLVTALLVWDLLSTVMNVVQGVVPPVKLFSSLIYAFGAFTVAVFFFVFQKRQSS